MESSRPAKLLRIHLSNLDKYRGKPVYEIIVQKCRDLGIAGATVFRGVEGFGESAEIHRGGLLLADQPVVVTVVDTEENVRRLLSVVDEVVDTGLIAMSDVEAIRIHKSRRLHDCLTRF